MPAANRTALIDGAICIVALLVAVVLVTTQVRRSQMLVEERVSLDYYIDGQVARPFAYRVLIPHIIRGIDALAPAWAISLSDRLGERISRDGAFGRKIQSGPENKYARAIAWVAALQFASLIGYAIVGSSLYLFLFGGTRRRRLLVGLALLLLLVPIADQKFGHIYDFTVLLFMASLLRAMASERHILYLMIFAFSCFNKETTVLMSVAYAAVFFRRMPVYQYAVMMAAQFVVFAAIYMPLRIAFGGNPGGGVEVHLYDQIAFYKYNLTYVYIAAIVVFMTTFRWNEKPLFLRRAAVMIVPHMALFIYGADPGEVRNLYEIMPLISMFIVRNMEFIPRRWWR